MKKILFAFIACLTVMQSAYAIESNLNESISQQITILESSLLQSTIPQDEFIVDLRRRTREIDVVVPTTVAYVVTTRTPGTGNDPDCMINDTEVGELHHHHSHHSHHSHSNHNRKFARYLVELSLTANPAIGPNIATVLSVTPL